MRSVGRVPRMRSSGQAGRSLVAQVLLGLDLDRLREDLRRQVGGHGADLEHDASLAVDLERLVDVTDQRAVVPQRLILQLARIGELRDLQPRGPVLAARLLCSLVVGVQQRAARPLLALGPEPVVERTHQAEHRERAGVLALGDFDREQELGGRLRHEPLIARPRTEAQMALAVLGERLGAQLVVLGAVVALRKHGQRRQHQRQHSHEWVAHAFVFVSRPARPPA
jgi:hypothetical protein